MSDPRVRLEVRGEVAEIVFSCPPVNALSHQFIDDLNQAIDQIPPNIRAVAVTSEVERVFMAGADIAFMTGASLEEGGEYLRSVQRTFRRIEQLDPPVVAGIDGACLGGGLEFALVCDIDRLRAGADRLARGHPRILAAAGDAAPGACYRPGGGARPVAHRPPYLRPDAVAIGLASRLVAEGTASEAARELAADWPRGRRRGSRRPSGWRWRRREYVRGRPEPGMERVDAGTALGQRAGGPDGVPRETRTAFLMSAGSTAVGPGYVNRGKAALHERGRGESEMSSAEGGRLKLLIVDDHEVVREGLAAALGEDPRYEIVGSVGDGRSTLERARRTLPDASSSTCASPTSTGSPSVVACARVSPVPRSSSSARIW